MGLKRNKEEVPSIGQKKFKALGKRRSKHKVKGGPRQKRFKALGKRGSKHRAKEVLLY